MIYNLFLLASLITSGFDVTVVKPYAAAAHWIVSEKYKGIICLFKVFLHGIPGYYDGDGVGQAVYDYPEEAGMTLLLRDHCR